MPSPETTTWQFHCRHSPRQHSTMPGSLKSPALRCLRLHPYRFVRPVRALDQCQDFPSAEIGGAYYAGPVRRQFHGQSVCCHGYGRRTRRIHPRSAPAGSRENGGPERRELRRRARSSGEVPRFCWPARRMGIASPRSYFCQAATSRSPGSGVSGVRNAKRYRARQDANTRNNLTRWKNLVRCPK